MNRNIIKLLKTRKTFDCTEAIMPFTGTFPIALMGIKRFYLDFDRSGWMAAIW